MATFIDRDLISNRALQWTHKTAKLMSTQCTQQYSLHLLGEMRSAPEVPELQQIQLRCADAADFLEHQPAGSFTGFSLSNILDGTNAAYEQRLFAAVQHAAAPGAMVVLRSFREPQRATRTNHAAEDRAMLWGVVDIRPASTL